VKRKAETSPEKDRDKLDQTYKHMQEQAEKEKEARDEMDKLRQLLDALFGNGKETPSGPERRRP
jgi:hypothetical protein